MSVSQKLKTQPKFGTTYMVISLQIMFDTQMCSFADFMISNQYVIIIRACGFLSYFGSSVIVLLK